METRSWARLAVALLATLATANDSLAGPATPTSKDPCGVGLAQRTQLDLTECAQHKYKQADARLNAAYQALLKGLDVERQDRLKAAQRAWIAFRDAECELDASQALHGSMEPQLRYECLEGMTDMRVKDIARLQHNLAELP